jgi:hypothetical protein
MADRSIGFFRANGLSLVLIAVFLGTLGGQLLTGHASYNEERIEEGAMPLPLSVYIGSGHFLSATFENWESEFLQMGMYVLLTVWLRQQGSAESRPFEKSKEEERIDPGPTPWPVRAGGLWKLLYANSLALAFFVLFAISFALHLRNSWRLELEERLLRGDPPISLWNHFGGPTFWFESFQNWQSEFFAVLAIVVLSIFLRQEGSPQSKPMKAPHAQTGS